MKSFIEYQKERDLSEGIFSDKTGDPFKDKFTKTVNYLIGTLEQLKHRVLTGNLAGSGQTLTALDQYVNTIKNDFNHYSSSNIDI
jgi:hypothetical protein